VHTVVKKLKSVGFDELLIFNNEKSRLLWNRKMRNNASFVVFGVSWVEEICRWWLRPSLVGD